MLHFGARNVGLQGRRLIDETGFSLLAVSGTSRSWSATHPFYDLNRLHGFGKPLIPRFANGVVLAGILEQGRKCRHC